MPTKITTLTVNELGLASAANTAATAAEQSATEAAASAAAALAAENSLLEWKGAWATATAYAPSDLVQTNGNTYVCLVSHTSGTFSTDLTNNYWELFAAKGDTGPGSGDLLSTNNLSDVADAAAARANLGLGAVAVENSIAYGDVTGAPFFETGTWTPTYIGAVNITITGITVNPSLPSPVYVRIGDFVHCRARFTLDGGGAETIAVGDKLYLGGLPYRQNSTVSGQAMWAQSVGFGGQIGNEAFGTVDGFTGNSVSFPDTYDFRCVVQRQPGTLQAQDALVYVAFSYIADPDV